MIENLERDVKRLQGVKEVEFEKRREKRAVEQAAGDRATQATVAAQIAESREAEAAAERDRAEAEVASEAAADASSAVEGGGLILDAPPPTGAARMVKELRTKGDGESAR